MSDRPRGDRWQRVEQVYHAALALPTQARAAFLHDACGSDDALRDEVESLLAVADAAEGFLERGQQSLGPTASTRAKAGSLVGRRIGPYQVVAFLDSGGMGDVYRATDTRLGRDVAMKVLPEAFSSDRDRLRRFEQEARAAAALNHPNIVAVFDVGTHDGVSYLVSELLEGETLRDVLTRGPLPIRKVVDYATQIASGLAAAHEKGIVHRDVKPENVAVSPDGRVKILDFGVAKLAEGIGPDDSTLPGTLIGTVGYLSPEQIRGQPVDGRSDIFGFGAMLYEMVTGRRAFKRETQGATLAAILSEDPPYDGPGLVQGPAATRVLNVARRCLEKLPQARFQSCSDLALVLADDFTGARPGLLPSLQRSRVLALALALLVVGLVFGVWRATRVPGGTTPATIRSLAVLPLENLSGGPDDGYFADSMTAALITNLAKIGALRVVSRPTIMRYKQTQKPLPQIGRELGVDGIVAGSIERVGDRVRISAQLIRAASDEHIWANSYERDIRDVLLLQDEVAQRIAREVRVTVTPEEEARLAGARAVHPEAYQLYVKGRVFWDRRTEESINRSIAYFTQAIEKDPNYAAAYTGLADCYLSLGFSFDVGSLPPSDAIPKAKNAAIKALSLDESLAEAHNSLAYTKLNYDWDWPGAEAEFKRSLDLNPGYAEAHHWYSHLLVSAGRMDEALGEARKALALDPLNPIMNVHLGWCYFFARQYDLALAQLSKATEIDPNFGLAYWYRGLAYEQQGKFAAALEQMRKAAPLLAGNTVVHADMGHVYAVAGEKREAEKVMRELQQESTRRFISPFEVAIIYIGLGQLEPAFEWLERAYRERSDLLIYLRVDPRLDSIRSDSRFERLAARVGIPH
jgi:serine/threonine-protein kinase